MDAGFIPALPFHHGYLEPDCVERWGGGGGGAYVRNKNTSARLCAKNAGGAYARGGAYLRDTTVYPFVYLLLFYVQSRSKVVIFLCECSAVLIMNI